MSQYTLGGRKPVKVFLYFSACTFVTSHDDALLVSLRLGERKKKKQQQPESAVQMCMSEAAATLLMLSV